MNIGIFSFVFFLIPIGLVALVVFFILRVIKRYEERANAKLMLERENNLTLQRRIDDLTERLTNIEKILKEVD